MIHYTHDLTCDLGRYSILSDTPATPLFSVEQCEQSADHAIQWPDVIKSTLDIEQAFHPENIIPGYILHIYIQNFSLRMRLKFTTVSTTQFFFSLIIY